MQCRACGSVNLTDYVDLGIQPPSNDYRINTLEQRTFELKMLVCAECGLGQLSEAIDPESIFNDYLYFSSQSPTWVEDRRHAALSLINLLDLRSGSLVVDLGSNDGYFLQHFVGTCSVLGYEPASNVATVANSRGIPTKVEFWGSHGINFEGIHADLINATNVLAHTPDMYAFIRGISRALAPNGVATLEFPLFSNLIKFNQLDTIYHEHYSYISVAALEKVLAKVGMRIWRIEELSTHGGSVRVFACCEEAKWKEEASVARVKAGELWPLSVSFEEAAQKIKWDILRFFAAERSARVVGYGAPAKATVLCNYVGLGRDAIKMVVDDSPYKQGKFIPGTNIPIVPFSELVAEGPPQFIFVFAWNLLEPIKAKLAKHYEGYPFRPRLVTAIPSLVVTNI